MKLKGLYVYFLASLAKGIVFLIFLLVILWLINLLTGRTIVLWNLIGGVLNYFLNLFSISFTIPDWLIALVLFFLIIGFGALTGPLFWEIIVPKLIKVFKIKLVAHLGAVPGQICLDFIRISSDFGENGPENESGGEIIIPVFRPFPPNLISGDLTLFWGKYLVVLPDKYIKEAIFMYLSVGLYSPKIPELAKIFKKLKNLKAAD